MPKRLGLRRVSCESVQGEGSWVELDDLTVKEFKEIRRKAKSEDYDDVGASMDLIEKHIVGWNWVDYNDKPLPIPSMYPAIVDTLTLKEMTFLANALLGEDEASKN